MMHRKGENSGSSMPNKASFINTARGFPADGGDFEFFSPPDAPVFRPTEEEFARGPIHYVASIRAIAEPFGICRIVPPPVSTATSCTVGSLGPVLPLCCHMHLCLADVFVTRRSFNDHYLTVLFLFPMTLRASSRPLLWKSTSLLSRLVSSG